MASAATAAAENPPGATTTSPTATSASSSSSSTAAPTAAPPKNAPALFEYFVSVPHPAASKSCLPMVVIPAPHAVPDPHLVSQIQAFCFPDYEEGRVPGPGPQRATATYTNMVLNKFDQYAMQPKSFSSFTFTLQLQDGRRLYGHVRRSLPMHEKSSTRYDVGRRGERALVLLTQTAGAGQLYQAILKSVDAIASLHKALVPSLRKGEEPQKTFLHSLFNEQQRMAAHYQQRPTEERGKPLIAAIAGVELQQSPHFSHQDVNRFMIPTCLLHNPYNASSSEEGAENSSSSKNQHLPTADSTSSVLPLLRCVGVAHALRILAALLSERRIILTSSSPTRLSTCSHAALAMLHCGLLHWQHLYIPVLPPHLWQYLAAPYPYLIGILQLAVPKLDVTDGLGEVLLVNLDTNAMETRNIPQQVVAQRLPDLFSTADPNYYNENEGGAGGSTTGGGGNTTPTKGKDKDLPPSASEFLAQDLLDILKTDKKTMHGENSALNHVGETAGKAAKAIKSGFSKLKKRIKGKNSDVSASHDDDDDSKGDDAGGATAEGSSVSDDYIFTEGCHNEVGEQEARLAFTGFFLAMIGNMRWYLTVPAQGQLPQLDRKRFLEQKRQAGDGQGSALWPLLQNFCQTQMFEEFAKARVEEIRLRIVVSTPDAPLFSQCSQYHRQHNIDFATTSVRRVSRQVAQANPGRLTGLLQTNARRMAMSLTSNKSFEGDSGRAIAQLVEQCRESSSVLFDVMSVVWLRLRDCKGMQWKHGHQAMAILKNLLYHGPLAAVAEATDGLEKIRAIKYYDHIRGGVAQDMRNSAGTLFGLLVDRSKLWAVRRLCAKKRRDLTVPPNKKPRLEKMVRIKPTDAIEQIHGAFHPLARATIVQVPAPAPQVPAPLIASPVAPSGPAPIPQSAPPIPQQAPVPAAGGEDFFGFGAPTTPSAARAPAPAAVNPDLMGLFDSMEVGAASSGEDPPHIPSAQQDASFEAQPTIAVLPPASAAVPTPPSSTAFSAPAPSTTPPPIAASESGELRSSAMSSRATSGGTINSQSSGMSRTSSTASHPSQPFYAGQQPPPPQQLPPAQQQQWAQPAAAQYGGQQYYGGGQPAAPPAAAQAWAQQQAPPAPQQQQYASPQYQQPQSPPQQQPTAGYFQQQQQPVPSAQGYYQQPGQAYGYQQQQPQQQQQQHQQVNPFAVAPAPTAQGQNPQQPPRNNQFDPFAGL